MQTPAHRWRFYRAGGVDQVAIRDGRDIARLEELDQKLWVALSMPVRGVALDEKTLELLDADRDGHVRAREVLDAIGWLKARLDSLDLLLTEGDAVPLAAIRDEELQAIARKVTLDLGKVEAEGRGLPPAAAGATEISLSQVAELLQGYVNRPFNGDGIIVAEAMPDEEARSALEGIIAALGGDTDRSGKRGAGEPKAKAFFEQAAQYLAWYDRPASSPELLPLGESTAAAGAALAAIREKVDDFFLRCRLAALDERAAGALSVEGELAALGGKLLSSSTPELRALPLGRVAPGRALPLRDASNPAWAAELEQLSGAAVAPLLGGVGELEEAGWSAIKARLEPYQQWQASKPATPVERLGAERLRALLAGDLQDRLLQLIRDDLALSAEMEQLAALEKLLRLRRDLVTLLQNFVSFSRFYAGDHALFQAGTLYIDGRACRLCLEVADPAKHALLAVMASTYLLYCDCTRADGQKKTIVAAVTAGESDRLVVGRNGVFYDRQGKDWDATVGKIVAQPISVREAFWAPYKRFARLVEEQVAKRAAAADTDVQTSSVALAQGAASADKPKPGAPKKIDVGTVAAIGVAVGGIGAMVTGLLSAFFGLGLWMPLGCVALLLMISGPSMLLAYLKLRQRNLGPILDANGWAINGRARVNVPFGAALTDEAAVPPGSERSLRDPFAEKKRPWKLYLVLLLLLTLAGSWALGFLDRYLPDRVRSARVLHRSPPPAPEKSAPEK